MFRLRIGLIALACALGTTAAVVAADAPTEEMVKGPSATTVVDRALEWPVSLHFDKQPLDRVVRELDRRLTIPVELNRAALSDVDCACDAPVTIDVKNVSLAAALAILLGPLDLEWCEQDDTLVITTPEDAEDNVKTRYYDVTGLIYGTGSNLDFDTLADLMVSVIAPAYWPDGTGPGPITPMVVRDMQLLAVPQTDANHREVRLFLDALRQAKHGPLEDKRCLLQPPRRIRYPDRAVCRALDRQVRLEIPGFPRDACDCVRPLSEVLRLLAEAADANLVLDHVALDDNRMKPETPICIHPMQGTLRACLNKICGARWAAEGTLHVGLRRSSPAPLRWTVANEVVWVTTREIEESMTPTRIYDVWDMPPEPTQAVETRAGGWIIDWRRPHEREKLTATIAQTIAPETWDSSGGLVRYGGPGISVLIVCHRWAVHQQIESFLAALRAARRQGTAAARRGR